MYSVCNCQLNMILLTPRTLLFVNQCGLQA